ncbi:hypothetical protein LJY25_17680 [Hymenobacter sp. BT175]|uniref:hypothetical protein n=1 Tax=Hymenobacter translucens TaxID=2886507 RepID=UPI001D0DFDBD|nr:hypothetical protein [Hymenobacter translucens]MCC2548284.1 hypothetical protein [Hymenobacter translucens]
MPNRSFTSAAFHPLVRRAAILAAVSLGLGLAMILYLFGWQDYFFTRLLGAFVLFFWLLAVTFLGVVPFISWATVKWFGADWAEENISRPRTVTSAPTSRKPARNTPRTETRNRP